jgi:hypothetical protein
MAKAIALRLAQPRTKLEFLEVTLPSPVNTVSGNDKDPP